MKSDVTANYRLGSAATTNAAATGQPLTFADRLGLPLEARLSLITTLPALETIEKEWLALEASCNSPAGLFQSYAWVHSWCKCYVKPAGPFELLIVAGYQSDRLVFAWPLMKTIEGGGTLIKWLTEPFGQYGDILIEPGQNTSAWMAQSLRSLSRLKGVDGIRLRHVREDAACAAFLNERFENARSSELAPYLDLEAYADEAAYEARYTSVQRKRRKKIRKALEQMGEFDFHQLPAGSLADYAIDQALAEKTKWLDERGRRNSVLRCANHARFIKELSRRRDPGFEALVTEITAGNDAVSWEIGYNYRGTHYGYVTSHREDLTDLSPGRLHMDMSQRLSLKQGMKRFDLMVPNDAHKESWCSDRIGCHDYFKSLSLRGFLYGVVYLRNIRPHVRRAYYASPQWLLRSFRTAVSMISAR